MAAECFGNADFRYIQSPIPVDRPPGTCQSSCDGQLNVVSKNPGDSWNRNKPLSLLFPLKTSLGPYTGTLSISDGTTFKSVPFNFHCTSGQSGELSIAVSDEYTYFSPNQPKVAGAIIKIIDSATDAIVSQGVTDASGSASLVDIPAGPYNLAVSAQDHDTYRGQVFVTEAQPTDVSIFVSRKMVHYNFVVIPTIEDVYNFVL